MYGSLFFGDYYGNGLATLPRAFLIGNDAAWSPWQTRDSTYGRS
jgi:hypothetical protein